MKEEGDRTKKSTKYRNMEEKIENLTSWWLSRIWAYFSSQINSKGTVDFEWLCNCVAGFAETIKSLVWQKYKQYNKPEAFYCSVTLHVYCSNLGTCRPESIATIMIWLLVKHPFPPSRSIITMGHLYRPLKLD
jgi:hypothetical protein